MTKIAKTKVIPILFTTGD